MHAVVPGQIARRFARGDYVIRRDAIFRVRQRHFFDLRTERDAAAILRLFHDEHNRLFGYSLEQEDTPVEIVNVRVQSIGMTEKLEAVGVPAGPINDLAQVFADPQVIHRGMRIDPPSAAAKAGSIPGLRTPIVLDGAPMASERPSPRLGEHSAEILREIGED